jgi:ABC-type lipoprotein export system ATPase subunit
MGIARGSLTLLATGTVDAGQAAQYTSMLPARISAALDGTPFAFYHADWSDPLGLAAGSPPDLRAQAASPGNVPIAEAAALGGVASHAVGFIWQQTSRNLLPYLTAQQNVELPMRLAGARARARRTRSAELLELLGLGEVRQRRPGEMSGGEQQRTAIAVALANEPKVLLADEPTGELDTATAAEVFAALQQANAELGSTVLIVTHDPAVSSVVRRVVAIRDGRTSTETLRHAEPGDEDEGIAVEYAVLDRAGRLQLPREMTEPLGMRDRVRLQGEADHIGVWPDRREAQ